MPSPWLDLLCLHGYLTDHELLRRLALRKPTEPHMPDQAKEEAPLAPPKQRIVAAVRLCLGIGDGLLRTQ